MQTKIIIYVTVFNVRGFYELESQFFKMIYIYELKVMD